MRKPVKLWAVISCLVISLLILSTLFIPMFSMRLNIGGAGAEYVNVTGLDIFKAMFGNKLSFIDPSTGSGMLSTFLLKSSADISQYVNPIYINILSYTYMVCVALAVFMLIVTIFNFFGIRLSVMNVFAGLFVFVCGIVTSLCLVLQNQEFVTNVMVEYNFKLSYGVVGLIVVGFAYMMVAPKKRY